MATKTMKWTDSYNNTSSNPASLVITYTSSYDPETNSSTITIDKVAHTYWSRTSYDSSWYITITATATDTSDASATTVFWWGRKSAVRTSTTGKTKTTVLTVQHSEAAGDKKVKLGCSFRVNYPISSSATTCTSKYIDADSDLSSGSVTATVTTASDQPAIVNTNNMLSGRTRSVGFRDIRNTSGSSDIMGSIIPFASVYNPITNETTITFSNGTLYHIQDGMKIKSSPITLTITPVDNEAGAQTMTITVPAETISSAQTIGDSPLSNYSATTVTVQHTDTADGFRKVKVALTPAVVKTYNSSGSSWTADTAPAAINGGLVTFISGVYGGTQGIVYIDNGTEFVAYQVYIDNGTGWDLYVPYIDDGTDWNVYG